MYCTMKGETRGERKARQFDLRVPLCLLQRPRAPYPRVRPRHHPERTKRLASVAHERTTRRLFIIESLPALHSTRGRKVYCNFILVYSSGGVGGLAELPFSLASPFLPLPLGPYSKSSSGIIPKVLLTPVEQPQESDR